MVVASIVHLHAKSIDTHAFARNAILPYGYRQDIIGLRPYQNTILPGMCRQGCQHGKQQG